MVTTSLSQFKAICWWCDVLVVVLLILNVGSDISDAFHFKWPWEHIATAVEETDF